MRTLKFLIINGPNLNMLKIRDNEQYGTLELRDIENKIKDRFKEIDFEFFQSNIEGEIVEKIQSVKNYFDGLIINPAAYSHTSVAIRDALEICCIPKIEVHLSNLSDREDFRQRRIFL